MQLDQLEKKLSIIFDKILADQEKGLKDNSFLQLSDYLSFNFPNTDMLIDIFSMISTDDKLRILFINILKKQVSHAEEIQWGMLGRGFSLKGISPTCFLCLVKIGYIKDALEALGKRKQGKIGIYTVINKILDENYFNAEQLEALFEIVKNDYDQHLVDITSSYKITSILQDRLIQLRHEFLGKEVKGTNVEINQDKKTVAEKIHLFGFDPKYQELLNCIDIYLITETSKPLNAGMINNLRTFMADLVTDIAQSIAKKEHEKIPQTKESKLGNMRSYLKIKLSLTDKDDKLIDSFIDILHSEGGHSFISEKEYFRLSMNIAIEIALFLLSKYGKRYPKKD